jgi:transposase
VSIYFEVDTWMALDQSKQADVKPLADKPESRHWKSPRKHHSREKKLQAVNETFAPGASVSQVARRHDINTNLLFSWIRQFENGGLVGPDKRELKREMDKFVAVGLLPKPEASGARQYLRDGEIEIENGGGVKVRLSGSVDERLLKLVLAEMGRPAP